MLYRVDRLDSSCLIAVFFTRFGEGVIKRSSSPFRFSGEMLGSTDSDFLSGDSKLLNLESCFGVFFLETNGRILTSGVSDPLLDESSDASRRLFRKEYDCRSEEVSSMDTFGTSSSFFSP
jgi:hypothetical protein